MRAQEISTLPPTEGIGISWGVGGELCKTRNIKKCMKLIWDFQKGEGVLEKIPSGREVWMFSGTTHCSKELEVEQLQSIKTVVSHLK